MSKTKFSFRNRPKCRWPENDKGKEILYKQQLVGQILPTRNGVFVIRIKANATQEQLRSNPNCDWEWKPIDGVFENVDNAVDFVNKNIHAIYDILYSGVK